MWVSPMNVGESDECGGGGGSVKCTSKTQGISYECKFCKPLVLCHSIIVVDWPIQHSARSKQNLQPQEIMKYINKIYFWGGKTQQEGRVHLLLVKLLMGCILMTDSNCSGLTNLFLIIFLILLSFCSVLFYVKCVFYTK